MVRLALDRLSKRVPKTPKKEEILGTVTNTVRRVRTKVKGRKNDLVRTPKVDTVE